MADVYDRWHKSHPKPDDPECPEHKSRTRRLVPTSEHGVGKRWQVRYRDLNGAQRKENYEIKAKADARAAEVENDLRRGVYVDPSAGKITLATYAEQWLAAVTAGPTTYERYEREIRNHIVPHLGGHEVRNLTRPSSIQSWIKKVQAAGLQASSIGCVHDVLVGMLDAAVARSSPPRSSLPASAGRSTWPPRPTTACTPSGTPTTRCSSTPGRASRRSPSTSGTPTPASRCGRTPTSCRRARPAPARRSTQSWAPASPGKDEADTTEGTSPEDHSGVCPQCVLAA
ncbi:N-terminal phage integrase SAM-like domain-containing protein [Streptomyces sp. B22F1]|uniref:N-terminal phage integrase SAM-like domain-containing protein n=1 Tax=Streptomyces sp. B22F1 TaxID=3153566 RepID=UPI00325F13B2